MTTCYCGNHLSFEECCEPFIKGIKKAPTSEALMRSRFSAYAIGEADYLVNTNHQSTRKNHKKSDILLWSTSNKWTLLEIIDTSKTTVHFKAHYLDNHKIEQIHEEKSTFVFENGAWFYVDGEFFN